MQYHGFAEVYDALLDDLPYDDWTAALDRVMKAKGVPAGGSVADLGCGTGSITLRLAHLGYHMLGVDISEEMLTMGQEKKEADPSHPDVLFVCQDMCELDLGSEKDALVSLGDSMNYITETEDLARVFEGCYRSLKTGGTLIFDMKTLSFYAEIGDKTITENRDEVSFIWDNWYDPETGINEYDLTLYVREKEDLFRRFDEVHYQRAYPAETVTDLLAKAGFSEVACCEAAGEEAPSEDTERYWFICRK